MTKAKAIIAAEILRKIEADQRWLFRAILRINSFQTSEEIDSESTRDQNGRGWNSCDAPFMTSLARQIEERGSLSSGQTKVARKVIKKYVGQLLSYMESSS